jgi:hypothetical protein
MFPFHSILVPPVFARRHGGFAFRAVLPILMVSTFADSSAGGPTAHPPPPPELPSAESVPRLGAVPPTGEGVHPGNHSRPWRMGQAWLPRESPLFQSGSVSMAWEPDALTVFAHLPDLDVFSTSRLDGQELFRLGDVFEIFIRRGDSEEYLELHVSPNGHHLHLRWSEEKFRRYRARVPLQEFKADPRAFSSRVEILENEKAWSVLIRIPSEIFTDGQALRQGDRFTVSFSRYDVDRVGERGRRTPVLSSTSPHKEANFHRHREWRTAVLD